MCRVLRGASRQFVSCSVQRATLIRVHMRVLPRNEALERRYVMPGACCAVPPLALALRESPCKRATARRAPRGTLGSRRSCARAPPSSVTRCPLDRSCRRTISTTTERDLTSILGKTRDAPPGDCVISQRPDPAIVHNAGGSRVGRGCSLPSAAARVRNDTRREHRSHTRRGRISAQSRCWT